MPQTFPGIPILSSVRQLAHRYPVWLCDIWGVLHNGVAAFPVASGALAAFRRQGGKVVLITNAPRPFDDVERQIRGLGVTPDAYDAIVTSGDVTRGLIRSWHGRPLFHLGPEKDRTIFEGLGAKLVSENAAEAVVCTGLIDDSHETPQAYGAQLNAMRKRGQPMICANPDIQVERGAQLCYCAGALGEAYERLGGRVEYAGKPRAPIYDAALAAIGGKVDRSKVLAIGDGVGTDIKGAGDFGLASLYVASAVSMGHGATLNAATLDRLFAREPHRPIAAISELAW